MSAPRPSDPSINLVKAIRDNVGMNVRQVRAKIRSLEREVEAARAELEKLIQYAAVEKISVEEDALPEERVFVVDTLPILAPMGVSRAD